MTDDAGNQAPLPRRPRRSSPDRAEDLKDEFFEGLGCTWNDLERKFNDDGLSGHVAKQKVLEMFREL